MSSAQQPATAAPAAAPAEQQLGHQQGTGQAGAAALLVHAQGLVLAQAIVELLLLLVLVLQMQAGAGLMVLPQAEELGSGVGMPEAAAALL